MTYDRILVAVDTTPDERNPVLQRTEQFAKMAGSTGTFCMWRRATSSRWTSSAHPPSQSCPLRAMPRTRLGRSFRTRSTAWRAAGIESHGEIVSATEHDVAVAEVILQRAKELDVDLIMLGSFSAEHSALRLVEISRLPGLATSTPHRLGEPYAWGALDRDDDLRDHIGGRPRELAGLAGCGERPHGETGDRRPSAAGLESPAPSGIRRRKRADGSLLRRRQGKT